MRISSTRLHLTNRATGAPNSSACESGDCSADERAQCRADLRDMVTMADNKLVTSLFPKLGGGLAGVGALGLGIKTAQGAIGPAVGVTGTLVAGAAGVGLYLYGNKQEKLAEEMFNAAFDKADETGCYTREELYQWYFDNFVR